MEGHTERGRNLKGIPQDIGENPRSFVVGDADERIAYPDVRWVHLLSTPPAHA